jgi:hypothetical protein
MINKKVVVFLGIFCMLLIIPFSSAGFSDWYAKITGELTTHNVNLNISVTAGSAPTIDHIWNETMTDISSSGTTEGPAPTYIMINFTASDADNYLNLDDTSAVINFTRAGTTRQNASCVRMGGSGNDANYTCNVTMWWWDATGSWKIQAYIKDLNGNSVTNSSANFSIGTTFGVVASPSTLTWSAISPSATNQKATNNPLLLNNTGNIVRNLEVNATNLLGETTPAKALYAANFSMNIADACEGTALVADVFTGASGETLPAGNYTLNNGDGQEQLYFCLEAANSDLTQQYYSTAARGAWTTKIVA